MAGDVTFDLEQGLIHLGGGASRILVPADALLTLCAAAGPDATAELGRAIGGGIGARLRTKLARTEEDGADAVRNASLETFVEALGTEVALAGLGSLSLERWGRALVLVIVHAGLPAPKAVGGREAEVLLASVLEAALASATGRTLAVGLLGREGARATFFVGASAAIAKVGAWLREGTSWGEALVRLHGGAAASTRGEA